MMNKILALYPDLEDHHILHEAFADSHNEIVCVTTVSEAVRLLVEQSFTLVLIDSKVIDRRSDEIATTIKTISNVPVIIADSVVYAKKDKTESPHGMEHHHKHGHIVHSDSGLIEVDSETCKLKVQGVSSLDGNIEYVTEVAEIALNTETGTGEIINPPGFVTFFSEGGYTVEFTLKYKENGTTVEKKTGRMLLGNKTTYDLPAGASDYEVSCLAWNGSSWKEKFDTYKSDTPFNCTFRTYGALPNPKMEIIYD